MDAQKNIFFWANFARIRRLYNKDQEVIQQESGGYTTRIRRLYNKDQEVISRIFWYWCYYPHWLRDALCFVAGFSFCIMSNCPDSYNLAETSMIEKWCITIRFIFPSVHIPYVVHITKHEVDLNLGGVYHNDVQLRLKYPDNYTLTLHICGVSKGRDRHQRSCPV